ncbi:hypothetical protein DFH09DRAFT_1338371 [Mycena vulgaris]|nr:hypothetical protein DFH09DRAFT_1338371 [Mycena vulgaris]
MSGIGSFISSLFPTTHADAEEEKPAPAEIAGAEEPKEAPAGEERTPRSVQKKVQAGEELCVPSPSTRSLACSSLTTQVKPPPLSLVVIVAKPSQPNVMHGAAPQLFTSKPHLDRHGPHSLTPA